MGIFKLIRRIRIVLVFGAFLIFIRILYFATMDMHYPDSGYKWSAFRSLIGIAILVGTSELLGLLVRKIDPDNIR
jgi:hypothetical protein